MFHVQVGQTDCVDVLIAEYNAEIRRGLRRLLEQEGYHCAEARNGREVLEVVRRRPPQCVLLDLVPTRDDIEVARRLRADSRMHAAYIHCLTWPTDELTKALAVQAGCNSVICKPVDPGKLLQVVRQELDCGEEWARGLTKTEAESLLDWLEHQGLHGEVEIEPNQTFAVRCPGFEVSRDADGHWMFCRQAEPKQI